nr:uncharacterized protein LOC117994536 [Maniola hyperantus]
MIRHSRRKLGSRNYKNYTQEMLDLAVDLVKKKNITSLEAEKRFLIPRRTIENKVKGLHMKSPGAQLRLSDSEEKDIVDVLIAAADFGSPLSRLDLRIVIFEYLNKNRRSCLFSGKIPGKWWVRHFLRRHKDALTERAVQNIKKARAEKTVVEFTNYFSNLEGTLINVPPQNILNYDETNLSDNPGSTKCIFKRKIKYPERILNHSKGNISIMFAASADGSLLPLYTVYKSEHLWSAWCVGGPPEARFNRTKSGWFDATVFEDWFRCVVIPWATKFDGPKVIIGDNLSSHLNVTILRLCEKHDIRFAFLPANSTHITQPLDVAYFGPLKKIWRRILTDYKIKNPSEAQINKTHFPILLKELLAEIQTCNKDNIKSGFKATGIVPFNPQKVLRKLPDYEEEIKYKIDTALLDFLKKTKAPDPLKKTTANKKMKLEPGCSISSQDAEKLMCGTKTRQKTATKKSNEPKTNEKHVTILSDVRFLPENQAYIDVKQCSSLDLKRIDAKSKLSLKKKETENINPYENPVPSTSGTCNVVKRKIPKRKQTQTKKPKDNNYDSDEENEDNYSLRDTSDEEIIMSEDEDIALCTILKHSKKYETDYHISTTLPDIGDMELSFDVETEKEKFQEFYIDEIEQYENKETDLLEIQNDHLKIDETNIENKKTDKDKKKQGILLNIEEAEMNLNEKTKTIDNSDMDEIKTIENENSNERKEEGSVILEMNEIGIKEKTDNESENLNMVLVCYKFNKYLHKYFFQLCQP